MSQSDLSEIPGTTSDPPTTTTTPLVTLSSVARFTTRRTTSSISSTFTTPRFRTTLWTSISPTVTYPYTPYIPTTSARRQIPTPTAVASQKDPYMKWVGPLAITLGVLIVLVIMAMLFWAWRKGKLGRWSRMKPNPYLIRMKREAQMERVARREAMGMAPLKGGGGSGVGEAGGDSVPPQAPGVIASAPVTGEESTKKGTSWLKGRFGKKKDSENVTGSTGPTGGSEVVNGAGIRDQPEFVTTTK